MCRRQALSEGEGRRHPGQGEGATQHLRSAERRAAEAVRDRDPRPGDAGEARREEGCLQQGGSEVSSCTSPYSIDHRTAYRYLSIHSSILACRVASRVKEDKRLLYEARIKALAGDD